VILGEPAGCMHRISPIGSRAVARP